MGTGAFPGWKRAILRKVKEINGLRGDGHVYVAQEIRQIDAEIAQKSRFRTETSYWNEKGPGAGPFIVVDALGKILSGAFLPLLPGLGYSR